MNEVQAHNETFLSGQQPGAAIKNLNFYLIEQYQ